MAIEPEQAALRRSSRIRVRTTGGVPCARDPTPTPLARSRSRSKAPLSANVDPRTALRTAGQPSANAGRGTPPTPPRTSRKRRGGAGADLPDRTQSVNDASDTDDEAEGHSPRALRALKRQRVTADPPATTTHQKVSAPPSGVLAPQSEDAARELPSEAGIDGRSPVIAPRTFGPPAPDTLPSVPTPLTANNASPAEAPPIASTSQLPHSNTITIHQCAPTPPEIVPPSLLPIPLAPPEPRAEYPAVADCAPAPGSRRRRIRRPDACEPGLWKLVCHERVSFIIRRFGGDAIRAVVGAQARRHASSEFFLYTPASYSSPHARASPLEAQDAMDVDGDADRADPEPDCASDSDESDDLDWDDGEDADMDTDTDDDSNADSMNADIPNANSSSSSSAAAAFVEEHPHAPVSRALASPVRLPELPRLASIRVPYLESCPVLAPDGRRYMGRGTPVDAARRRDWAAPAPRPKRAPSPARWQPTPTFFDSPFAPGSSPAPHTPSAFVPPEVHFPAGDYLMQGLQPPQAFAGYAAQDSAFEYGAPAPGWVGEAPAAQSQTGCPWHSSFLQCLLGVGVACGNFPAPAEPATSTPALVAPAGGIESMLPLPVSSFELGEQQMASSTLSHALG